MQNPEDFRRKFLNRPQQARTEKANEKSRAEQARLNYEADQDKKLQQLAQEKAELLQRQQSIIFQAYETTGIRARTEAIASIISNGKIIQLTEVHEEQYGYWPGITTVVSFQLPYHVFVGRVIIRDETLYSPVPPPSMASGGGSGGNYGEKLDRPTNLTDYLKISLSNSSKAGEANKIGVVLTHMRWREEEMWWTKAIFNKRGWRLGIEKDRSLTFGIVEDQIKSDYVGSIEVVLDSSFNQIYDSYLAVTGQI